MQVCGAPLEAEDSAFRNSFNALDGTAAWLGSSGEAGQASALQTEALGTYGKRQNMIGFGHKDFAHVIQRFKAVFSSINTLRNHSYP